MADLASGLAGATPWGAALGALSSALGTTPSSNSNTGAINNGPISVSVSGFGSKSSADASATQSTPSSTFAASDASSSWILPVAIVIGLALVAFAIRK